MSIRKYSLNGRCDGESGRCLADMVGDEEGDYVLYDDHFAKVDRLQAELIAQFSMWEIANERAEKAEAEAERLRELNAEWERKASAWMASPEAAQRLDGYRELAQRLNAAEAERDALRAALRELALCANTVDGCYTRNPGNFAVALCDMRDSSARAWELVDAARGES